MFNVDKCQVLHIGRSGKCGVCFYEMNQVFLSEVQCAKYLGVLLLNDMSWSPHISSFVHKAHQSLGFIRRNLWGSPFKYWEIAHQSPVCSQLEYCANIWDHTHQARAGPTGSCPVGPRWIWHRQRHSSSEGPGLGRPSGSPAESAHCSSL